VNASSFRPVTSWIPVAMSLAALAIVLLRLAMFGPAPQRDEGTAAHLWQLLMAGQTPFLIFYGVIWLRRSWKTALQVMGIQLLAIVAACAPIYLLRW
jgi:hypothetical protein